MSATTIPQTCEREHEVSDDAFGYWHADWGTPPSHTFACGERATAVITYCDEASAQAAAADGETYGPEALTLCAEHAEEFRHHAAQTPWVTILGGAA